MPSRAAAERGQVPGHEHVAMTSAVPRVGELELVRVDRVAVGHPDGRDLAVGAVEDPAGAEAAVEAPRPLPPGQHRRALVLLACGSRTPAGRRPAGGTRPARPARSRIIGPCWVAPRLGATKTGAAAASGVGGVDRPPRAAAGRGASAKLLDALVARRLRLVERRRRRVRGGRDHERGRVAVGARDGRPASTVTRSPGANGSSGANTAPRRPVRAPAAAVLAAPRAGHREVAELAGAAPRTMIVVPGAAATTCLPGRR